MPPMAHRQSATVVRGVTVVTAVVVMLVVVVVVALYKWAVREAVK
jgi:hypothetical protein